jgi:hypothetical protein
MYVFEFPNTVCTLEAHVRHQPAIAIIDLHDEVNALCVQDLRVHNIRWALSPVVGRDIFACHGCH